MEPIIFKMRLPIEDFLRVSKHLTWRLVFRPVRVAIYTVALAFMVFQAFRTGDLLPFLIVAAVLMAMLVYIVIRVPLSLRKKYEENFRSQEELEFRMDDRTCRITGQTFHLDLPWDKVLKVEKWEEYYLLFISKFQAHAVRADALGQGQERSLIALLDQVKPDWRKS
ncbi:MAG TPA: YcxB family protein [Flavobacteriales bacterium]|nr:YcxB family protein [Flavobacteriales bacterium]